MEETEEKKTDLKRRGMLKITDENQNHSSSLESVSFFIKKSLDYIRFSELAIDDL